MANKGIEKNATSYTAEERRLRRRSYHEAGLSSRCSFHEGYLESLSVETMHDAATCFLVSQFILDARARSVFFRQIADRLVPGGILANADLSADVESEDYDALLAVWQRVMDASAVSAEGLDRMKSGYAKDVAILPSAATASIIEFWWLRQAGSVLPSGADLRVVRQTRFPKCDRNVALGQLPTGDETAVRAVEAAYDAA